VRQTILITGATSGIGREAARELAQRGAEVVVGGRDEQKAQDTVSWIRRETGNEAVDYLLADFASLQAVRGLAAEFAQRYGKLDVLVNNAGAVFLGRQLSEDGYEMTLAVNHLAPFLLTNLLLPMCMGDGPARVVTVASDAHENATIDPDDLLFGQDYGVMKAYGRSKLANILFSYELARRIADTRITSNAMHPGFVSTGMGGNNLPGWAARLLRAATGLVARDAAKGAETVVYLAAAPEVADVSGKYFIDRKAVRSSPLTYDETLARRLWEVSAQMVGLETTV
jgi:NAD(P)-dependent dehydrogenase (short-subunit alcohol dehydrogenase family)